jgi:hypothetical protein
MPLRAAPSRGKCDGLTANPATGLVVATVNEDAHSSLYTINPFTGQVVHYSYNKPLPHFGGTGLGHDRFRPALRHRP